MYYSLLASFVLSYLLCGHNCVIFDKNSLPKDYVRDGLRLNNAKEDPESSSAIKKTTSTITQEVKEAFGGLDDHDHDPDEADDDEHRLFTEDETDTKDLAEYVHTRAQQASSSISKSSQASHQPGSASNEPKTRRLMICEDFLRRKQGHQKISQSLRYHVDIDDHKQLDLTPAIPKNDIVRCVKSLEKIEAQGRLAYPPIRPLIALNEYNLWPDKTVHPHNQRIIQRLSDVQLVKLVSLLNNALEKRVRPSPGLGKMPILGKQTPVFFSAVVGPNHGLVPMSLPTANRDMAVLSGYSSLPQAKPLMVSNYKRMVIGSPLTNSYWSMFSDKQENSPYSNLIDANRVKKKIIDPYLGIKEVEKFNGDRELEIDGGPKTVVVHDGQLHVQPKGGGGHIEINGENVRKSIPHFGEEPFNGFRIVRPINSLHRLMEKSTPQIKKSQNVYPLRDGLDYDSENQIYPNLGYDYHHHEMPLHSHDQHAHQFPKAPMSAEKLPVFHSVDSFESSPKIKQCGSKGPNEEMDADCPVSGDGIKAKYKAKSPFHKMSYAKYGSKYLALRLSSIANYAMGNLMGILYAPFMKPTNAADFEPVEKPSSPPFSGDDGNSIEQELDHLLEDDKGIDD